MAWAEGDGSYERLIMGIYGGKFGENLFREYKEYNEIIRYDALANNEPNLFLLTGYYVSGSFYNRFNFGYYWENKANNKRGYDLRLTPNTLNPKSVQEYKYGFSVRCVAKSYGKML